LEGLFQDYFKWKAKVLGVDKLQRFDIYAPLETKETNISLEDSIKLVLETFDSFSPAFGNNARRVLDANHVDSHPKDKKRSGAFCMTVSPNIVPYVMLNFTGKNRDVSTLAHELGHAVHSLYAENLSLDVQHAPLPFAETAFTVFSPFANANLRDLEKIIYSTGFYRNKAKNIKKACQKIMKDFNGQMPSTMQELTTLPGVGRKSANVVMSNVFGKNQGIVVDNPRLTPWTTPFLSLL